MMAYQQFTDFTGTDCKWVRGDQNGPEGCGRDMGRSCDTNRKMAHFVLK